MTSRHLCFVQAVLFGVILGSLGVQGRLFRLASCASNRQRQLLTFSNTRVSPHPIVLPGEFSVTSSLRVFHNVTADIMLDVKVERDFSFFRLPIPCIQGVGSCQYHDVCGLLRSAFGNGGARCPYQLRRAGVPCTCPMPAGTYTMTNGIFSVPHLSSVWAWLAQGDYRVTARLKDTVSGEEIACQRLDISFRAPCNNIFCRIFG